MSEVEGVEAVEGVSRLGHLLDNHTSMRGGNVPLWR